MCKLFSVTHRKRLSRCDERLLKRNAVQIDSGSNVDSGSNRSRLLSFFVVVFCVVGSNLTSCVPVSRGDDEG